MAKFRCPSCGASFNGKRCRSCNYEHFTEEIAHGSHTHAGEPLVIDTDYRRPIPRQDPFACPPQRKGGQTSPSQTGFQPPVMPEYKAPPLPQFQPPTRQAPVWNRNGSAGRKPSGSRKTVWPVRVFFLVWGLIVLLAVLPNLLVPLFGGFGRLIPAVPEPELPGYEVQETAPNPADFRTGSGGTTLYEKDGIFLGIDWQEGEPLPEELPVYLQNNGDLSITIFIDPVAVNGYGMNSGNFVLEADPGSWDLRQNYLSLEELALAEVETLQSLSFQIQVTDRSTWQTIDLTRMALSGSQDLAIQPFTGGQLLLDQQGIQVSCRGYLPDEYDPETLIEGQLIFYVENNTDHLVTLYDTGAQVNGEPSDISFFCKLLPQTRAMVPVYLYSLEEAKSLAELQTVAFQLRASDEDTQQELFEDVSITASHFPEILLPMD